MDDNNKSEEEVQEGEVVTSDIQTTQTPSDSSATVLESLESLIKENLAKIAKLQQEANQQKEMIDSVLANDETYRQHEEAAKAAAKVRTATKQEILKRPENAKINAKLKELKAEINEIRESMSSYLQEYRRLSGSDEIENENGEPMQIVYKAVLVRRKP